MNVDDRVREIFEIWHSIEDDTKFDLGRIWLDKNKLEYMEAELKK